MKRLLGLAALLFVLAPAVRADPLDIVVVGVRAPLPGSRCYDCGVGLRTPASVHYVDLTTAIQRQKHRAHVASSLKAAQTAPVADVFAEGMTDITGDVRDPDLGEALLAIAGHRGYRPAQTYLAGAASSDPATKIYWLQALAENGSVADWLKLANACDVQGDRDRAKAWYVRAADAGDVPTQVFLGGRYADTGGAAGRIMAIGWYRRAAAADNSSAMMALGALYAAAGPGHDSHAALSWYQQAATQGRVDGQVRVADLYDQDPDLQDTAEAIRQYARAAEMGDSPSANKLCVAYGGITPAVLAEARRTCLDLYRRQKLVDPASLSALAMALHTGTGLARDDVTARVILTGIVIGFTPENTFLAGQMMVDGTGGPAAPVHGIFLIRKAAQMAKAAGDADVEAEATGWLDAHPDTQAILAAAELDVSHLPREAFIPTPEAAPQSQQETPSAGLTYWLGRQFAGYYPPRAQDDEVEGRATLYCFWQADGNLGDCWTDEDVPVGYGFGAASAKALVKYLHLSHPDSGEDGKWSAFTVKWQLGG